MFLYRNEGGDAVAIPSEVNNQLYGQPTAIPSEINNQLQPVQGGVLSSMSPPPPPALSQQQFQPQRQGVLDPSVNTGIPQGGYARHAIDAYTNPYRASIYGGGLSGGQQGGGPTWGGGQGLPPAAGKKDKKSKKGKEAKTVGTKGRSVFRQNAAQNRLLDIQAERQKNKKSPFKAGETGVNYATYDDSQGFQLPGVLGTVQSLFKPGDAQDSNWQNPNSLSIVSEGYGKGEVDPRLAKAAGYSNRVEDDAGSYGLWSGRGSDVYGQRGLIGDVGGKFSKSIQGKAEAAERAKVDKIEAKKAAEAKKAKAKKAAAKKKAEAKKRAAEKKERAKMRKKLQDEKSRENRGSKQREAVRTAQASKAGSQYRGGQGYYNMGGPISLNYGGVAQSQIKEQQIQQAQRAANAPQVNSGGGVGSQLSGMIGKKLLSSLLGGATGGLGGVLGGLFNDGGMVGHRMAGGRFMSGVEHKGTYGGNKGFSPDTFINGKIKSVHYPTPAEARNQPVHLNMGGPLAGNPNGYNEGGAAGETPIKKVMDEQKLAQQAKAFDLEQQRKQEAHDMAMKQKKQSFAEAQKMKKASATTKMKPKAPLGAK